jgi:phospholipid/cholesterol/gamma-HCH transport system substrate-binding protein
MYATDEQYNSIVTQLRDLRKSIAQFRVDMRDSRAGLQDEATYNRLRTMLASADTALDALDKGTTAELLNNPQLYESLAMSLKSIGDMVRDFGANPRKYLRAKVF